MNEALILAGGKGLRLKGHTDIPKPFLIIREDTGETLFEAQLKWLVSHDFEHVIVAISRENFKYMRVNYSKFLNVAMLDFSIEEEFLGTSGAIKKALPLVEEQNFYCHNIDDVVDYAPQELFQAQYNHNAVLIKQATLPFGAVNLNEQGKVLTFIEKPLIDKFVSCGHYAFNKEEIENLLQDSGDLELTLLKDLARLGLLYSYKLEGKWITINSMKELLQAKEQIQ